MSHTLSAALASPSDLPGRLSNPGALVTHGDRLHYTGASTLVSNSPWVGFGTLEDALESWSHALSLASNGHLGSTAQVNNLAMVVSNSHQPGSLGSLGGHEMLMESMSKALPLMPDAHPDLPKWLSVLGAAHGDRFRRLSGLDDLGKAIEYTSRALNFAPNDDPDQTDRLDKLGEFHIHRFRHLGELSDLEKAMEYMLRAVGRTPSDHSDLPRRLSTMGTFHSDRFHHLGVLIDGDKAVEYGLRALALAPDGHPDLPKWLNSLGASYRNRFQRLGETNDLEIAIMHLSRACALTPDGHPDTPDVLSNLGTSYRDRYLCLGELDDMESAIDYNSRALTLPPDGHPDLPKLFSNLGASHRDRFQRLGELNNLEQAINFTARAVELTPGGHPDLPKWLTSLGESYENLYKSLGQQLDLFRAIDHAHRACILTSDGHPSLPTKYSLLARLRLSQSEHMHNDLYLLDTLKYFRMASQSLAGAPRIKFQIALQWARLASQHNSLKCIEAYQTTIDLLPQFIWLGATINQRYQDLVTAGDLAVEAAAIAIHSSDYVLALEWLEHARCVVWYQSLMLRSPLDELSSRHPKMAECLQKVSKKLNDASSESREARAFSSGSLTPEEVGQEHRRMAEEYDDLLSQARKLPGFEDLLQPKKANELVRAARIGPIVVINCHTDRCDALVILPQQSNVACLPLPNFTSSKAQDARATIESSLRRMGLRGRGIRVAKQPGDKGGFKSILAMLWNDVVKPTLDFLGYTSKVPTGKLPHITWYPTGVASFLPFHAAGDYDQPDSRVFNYAISSYTPTLTALLSSTPSTLNRNSRVLGIGQMITPGHSPLPGVTRELNSVRSHIENRANYLQLINAEATPLAVLDAMGQHDWVHLACHAHQNVSDPTKSGFFLHGGTLYLSSINRVSVKGRGLAFLSACQTATGDQTLPDEAIHLASGMIMAGYPSVIATMWSIVDEDAWFVADKVYGQLVADGNLGNGAASRALHSAIAELRDRVGEEKFERWVPYIHIGS